MVSISKTVLCVVAASAVLMVTTLPARAGNVPAQFAGKPVCVDIEQRYQRRAGQHNTRELNFMLFDASTRNCIKLMPILLKTGASVTARNRFGSTALLIAAHAGHVEAIDFLLAADSDIAHANLAGSTALLQAVDANRRKATRILLKAGADPDRANTKKISPLIAASFNGNRKLVKLLLKAGADPPQTAPRSTASFTAPAHWTPWETMRQTRPANSDRRSTIIVKDSNQP